jgi:hypothetical protein
MMVWRDCADLRRVFRMLSSGPLISMSPETVEVHLGHFEGVLQPRFNISYLVAMQGFIALYLIACLNPANHNTR